jgi:hypothetical protein
MRLSSPLFTTPRLPPSYHRSADAARRVRSAVPNTNTLQEEGGMPIIQNVNVSDSRTSQKVAYAAQANYDTTYATITLIDGVVIYNPLVLNTIYVIDSKQLAQPVDGRYTGTNGAGNPVFLIG